MKYHSFITIITSVLVVEVMPFINLYKFSINFHCYVSNIISEHIGDFTYVR
jgi:hypothetical protein